MSSTGNFATQGVPARNGYMLCQNDINAKGGVLGRKIEFLIYDDKSDPKLAIDLYEKLITEDKVDAVLGPYGSTHTEAIAPVTEKHKMVLISPLAATTSIWEKGRKYIFMQLPPAELFLGGLIDLASRNGLETVAIIEEEEQKRGEAQPTAEAERFGDEKERAAAAAGDTGWLRARREEGSLVNPVRWNGGGLLTVAVRHNRPEVLALLLEFGFDPDERVSEGEGDWVAYSQGYPLWYCAALGRREMAEMLLQRGASPSVHVDSSGSAVYSAYSHKQWEMVELLRRHGGVVSADTAAIYRQTDLARQMLADEARGVLAEGIVAPGRPVAEELLNFGASGGEPRQEIVEAPGSRIDEAETPGAFVDEATRIAAVPFDLGRAPLVRMAVRKTADAEWGWIVVMHQGKIVQQGPKQQVLTPPHHAYTELLLSSVPEMDPRWLDGLLARRAKAATGQPTRAS